MKVLMLAVLSMAAQTIEAQTVWNVNVGSNVSSGGGNEITTNDNYIGAATENTFNSTWNGITSEGTKALADSTGDSSAGVTCTMTANAGSAIDFAGQGLTAGDKIFVSWTKDGGANGANNDPYTVTLGNLNTNATSYSLLIYSDWYWGDGAVKVQLTAGTGLSGDFVINSPKINFDGSGFVDGVNGAVGPLLVDTNAANALEVYSNHARFDGLMPNSSGDLTVNIPAVNGPFNGLQLIQFGPPDATGTMVLTK